MKETNVKFSNVRYTYLAVYLTLVLGSVYMRKMGLSDCLPTKIDKRNESKSLMSASNKDMNTWDFSKCTFNEKKDYDESLNDSDYGLDYDKHNMLQLWRTSV